MDKIPNDFGPDDKLSWLKVSDVKFALDDIFE